MIEIRKPCDIKYEELENTSCGKFCDRCKMNLIDFTDNTDSEIHDYISHKENEIICGVIREKKSHNGRVGLKRRMKSFFMPFVVLLASCGASKEYMHCELDEAKKSHYRIIEKKLNSQPIDSITVWGKIMDNEGQELIAAQFSIAKRDSTISNGYGKFAIKAPSNYNEEEYLSISYIGCSELTIPLKDVVNSEIEISMEPSISLSIGTVVIKEPFYKRWFRALKTKKKRKNDL